MRDAQESAEGSNPHDHYWALDAGETLIAHLYRRRKEFYSVLEETGLQARISRNYDYLTGQFFKDVTDTRGKAIKRVEKTGTSLLAINEFRPLLTTIGILVTENPPAWDCLATAASHEAIQQTIHGNDLLDHEMDGPHHTEEFLRQSVEDALWATAGYDFCFWDKHKGPEIAGDLSTGQVVHEGDVSHENPSFYDVIYPFEFPWRAKEWVCVYRKENKWDLLAEHPEAREEILAAAPSEEARGIPASFERIGIEGLSSDQVEVGYFFHLKTSSVRRGRKVRFVAGKILEDSLPSVWGEDAVPDDPNTLNVWSGPEEGQEPAGEPAGAAGEPPPSDDDPDVGWPFPLPVHRIIPSKYPLSSFGYTIAFDLQGPQEAMNAEISTILNNHKNHGILRVWQQQGDTPNVEQFDSGASVLIQSKVPPQTLDLMKPMPEGIQMVELLRSIATAISGMNEVARGQQTDKATSGVALALIDQKAQQAASTLIANWYQLLADVGTAVLLYYKAYAHTTRVMPVIGANSRTAMIEWTSGSLSSIERVAVKAANPLSRTLSGRFELAKFLSEGGYVKNTQEIITVLNTGSYKPLMRAEMSELSIIHDENERLLRGEPVRVSPLDDHGLHLTEQHAILDSTELRQDPVIGAGCVTHLMQHVKMAKDPGIQELQLALGRTIPQVLLPPPPPQMGAGGPPGAPPGAPPGGAGAGRRPSPKLLGGPAGAMVPGLEPTGNKPEGMPRLSGTTPAGESLRDAKTRGRIAKKEAV